MWDLNAPAAPSIPGTKSERLVEEIDKFAGRHAGVPDKSPEQTSAQLFVIRNGKSGLFALFGKNHVAAAPPHEGPTGFVEGF